MWNKKCKAGLLTSLLAGGLISATPLYALDVVATYPGEAAITFDTYDFGPDGIASLTPQPGSLTNFDGVFLSYVSLHTLDRLGVAAPNLSTTGEGDDGYELTVEANFVSVLTSDLGDPQATFTINPGGTFNLFLQSPPDFDFGDESTFSNGGPPILTGEISGGSGSLFSGQGFTFLNLTNITGDPAGTEIFAIDEFEDANTIFTLTALPDLDDDPTTLDLTADGKVKLEAVPIPAAVWLFGSALLGFVAISRRQKV